MSLVRKIDTSTTSSSGRSEDEEKMYTVEMGSPEAPGDSDSSFSDPRQRDSDGDSEECPKESEEPLLKIKENVNIPSLQLDTRVDQKKLSLEKAKRIREDRIIHDDQKMLCEKSNKLLKFSQRLSDNSETFVEKNLMDIERLKPNNDVENEKNLTESEDLETSSTSEVSPLASPTGRWREKVEAEECSCSSSDERESLLPSPSSPTNKSVSPKIINKIQCEPWNKRPRSRRLYCADDVLQKVNEKLSGLAVE